MSGAILSERGDDHVGDAPVVPSSAVDQVDSLHPPHPGELAANVGAVGPLDRVDVPLGQFLKAQGSPRGARRAGLGSRTGLVRGTRGDHLVHPGVDPAGELLAVHGQAHEQSRATHAGRPKPLAGARRLDPGSLQLGHAHDALAVVWVDRRREVRVELPPERLGPTLGELALDLGANLRWNRRSQVQVRERRPQVQPGPANRDRAPSLGQQLVDLLVREGGELPGAELTGRVDEADEAVLQAIALRGRGRAAERLEPPVDLNGVARHGDRILTSGAQPLGDGDRDRRFPDSGRAKDRENVDRPATRSRAGALIHLAPGHNVGLTARVAWRSRNCPCACVSSQPGNGCADSHRTVRPRKPAIRAPQGTLLRSFSWPASVVEVALVISTSTISPWPAVPSKLTVLLWPLRPRRREGSVRLGPSTRTSTVRPTNRWPRSRARRWTTSTRRSMRSRLTGWES